MKFFKFLRFDLVNGILRAFWRYAAVLLLFGFLCYDFTTRRLGYGIPAFSFGDLLFYAFSGMEEYIPSPDEPLRFPALWMLLFSLLLYGTLTYADTDLNGLGRQALVHSGGRGAWWLSKCAWNFCSVLLFFLCGWAVLFLYCLLFGGALSVSLTPYAAQYVDLGNAVLPEDPARLSLRLLLVTPLAAAALSMLQMAVSVRLRPIFCYTLSLILLLASAYSVSPWLLGNYMMAQRHSAVLSNGTSDATGLLYAALVLAGSVLLGYAAFRKKDIVNREVL